MYLHFHSKSQFQFQRKNKIKCIIYTLESRCIHKPSFIDPPLIKLLNSAKAPSNLCPCIQRSFNHLTLTPLTPLFWRTFKVAREAASSMSFSIDLSGVLVPWKTVAKITNWSWDTHVKTQGLSTLKISSEKNQTLKRYTCNLLVPECLDFGLSCSLFLKPEQMQMNCTVFTQFFHSLQLN